MMPRQAKLRFDQFADDYPMIALVRFRAIPVLWAACGTFAEGAWNKVLQTGRTFALASPMATSYYHK